MVENDGVWTRLQGPNVGGAGLQKLWGLSALSLISA